MQLQAFLPFRIARLAAKTTAAVAQIYSERFGLTRDEWRVLAATGEAQDQPTRAIAEQTGLDKVAISRAASSLEDRGLIQRWEDRRDRRIKMVRLTREGGRTLADIERLAQAREAYLLDGLTEQEREVLERVIVKLADRAEALADPAFADRCRPDCTGDCQAHAASEEIEARIEVQADAAASHAADAQDNREVRHAAASQSVNSPVALRGTQSATRFRRAAVH